MRCGAHATNCVRQEKSVLLVRTYFTTYLTYVGHMRLYIICHFGVDGAASCMVHERDAVKQGRVAQYMI